ncbi:zinc finger protein 91-like [Armigeres subalbatus]|uniref:zinc finger protein 91-like n=1 Tax=Armigeres subalbatus TaxID=124917 RepID=UPI002ED15939
MNENLADCLTCQRKTDNFLRILDATNVEDIGAILSTHFWFQANQYDNRILCTSCWEKIEDFHKFYCDVEQLWGRDGKEIKTEQLFNEDEQQQKLFACELIKEIETRKEDRFDISSDVDFDDKLSDYISDTNKPEDCTTENIIDSEIREESNIDDNSEEDSTLPIARRCRSFKRNVATFSSSEPIRKQRKINSQRKTNIERNEFILKNVDLRCNRCEHRSTTLSRLFLHYRRNHDMQGYVICCDRKFQKKSTLFDHLCRHESNDNEKDESPPFQCERCEPVRLFKDEEGLQLHKVVCHSEESERKFKCNQCEKAFASDWQLSGHKNWHQNVESLNIYCDKCNKYFNSVRTLNTHVRAHHAESANALPSHISSMSANGMAMISSDSNVPNPIVASVDRSLSTNTHISENCMHLQTTSTSSKKVLKTTEELAQQDELIRKFCTLICEKCEFVGENYYQLEKHYKSEHKMRGYAICCGRKFCKKRRLFEHCQRHVNPDMFRCELCSKSFTESDGLEKHNKWVHTPDSQKPFKCEICDAAFYKDYLLRNHMKYHISMEQKIFNCKDCDKSFGTAVLLRAHQQNIHGAASSWVCDICAKGFVHKSLLETHRLSHTEEGAASLKKQCEHCKKWLKNKDTYVNHLKRCLAGGPVTCDVCGKEAVNELALASHKRFNHEERPAFACSYCGKQFKRVLRLKEHEANHRGEVLYSCPYCPRTCNSSSNMYTHKKVAHPELWAAKVADRFYKR